MYRNVFLISGQLTVKAGVCLTPYTRQMCIRCPSSILFDVSASGSEARAPADGRGGRVHAGTQTGVQRSHEDTPILHPSSCTQKRSVKGGG